MSFKDISLFAKIYAGIGLVIYLASGTAFFFTVIAFNFLAPLAFEVFTDRSPEKKRLINIFATITTVILLGFMPIMYFIGTNPFAPMNSTIVLTLFVMVFIVVGVIMKWFFPPGPSGQVGKSQAKKTEAKSRSKHLRSVS